MLGIGGVRALRALGIDAAVWHMNEGHSAFLGLERCRELVAGAGRHLRGRARDRRRQRHLHHPHPRRRRQRRLQLRAGRPLLRRLLAATRPRPRGVSPARRARRSSWGAGFGMTVLALRLSAQHNGVSKLHGAVSRAMWQFLWPEIEEEEVPIGSITNGVHTATWLAPRLAALYTRYLGPDWYDRLDDPRLWSRVDEIPDGELWEAHRQLKGELIAYARARVARQRRRIGEGKAALGRGGSPARLQRAHPRLRPPLRHLQARHPALPRPRTPRAAAQQRGPPRADRLRRQGPPRRQAGPGVHPAGLRVLAPPGVRRASIVFLEDYDIDMARQLVSGVDVWLNTPIRPHEASGTSGEKAASTASPTAASSTAGGTKATPATTAGPSATPRDYQDAETRDDNDADALYTLLEREIVPLYYDRGLDEIPHNWVAVMKEAIKTCRAHLQHAPHGQRVRRVALPARSRPRRAHRRRPLPPRARADRVGASVSASTGQMSRSRSRGRAMVSSKSVSRSR